MLRRIAMEQRSATSNQESTMIAVFPTAPAIAIEIALADELALSASEARPTSASLRGLRSAVWVELDTAPGVALEVVVAEIEALQA